MQAIRPPLTNYFFMKDSWDWLWAVGIGLIAYILLQIRKKDPFEAPLPSENSEPIRQLKKRLSKVAPPVAPTFSEDDLPVLKNMEEELCSLTKIIESQKSFSFDAIEKPAAQKVDIQGLLKNRNRLREAFIMKEIMDKPIAWRG